MSLSNRLLEERLRAVSDTLDALAAGVDANLRRVHGRLLSENKAVNPDPLQSMDDLARTARSAAFLLVARSQPLARDLKFAMGALRVAHDYERIQELTLAFNERINRLANTPVETFLADMSGVVGQILEMHSIVSRIWHRTAPTATDTTTGPVSTSSETAVIHPEPKSRVLALIAATEAELAEIQNSIVEAVAKGYGSPEMLVELVLSCRHLQRITQLMEGIPDDAHSFD